MGINYYQVFLVYLIFPMALVVYVYLSYRVVLVLMQQGGKLPSPQGMAWNSQTSQGPYPSWCWDSEDLALESQ